MKNKMIKAIAWMSAKMPKQGEINEDAYLETLMEIASDFRSDAVIQAAENFRLGKAGSGFAPTAKEFREESLKIHQRKEAVDAANLRQRLPPPTRGARPNISNSNSILERNRIGLLNEGRKIIDVNVALADFDRQCKKNAYPKGATWIPTGEVFGPRGGDEQSQDLS